jgi:hypothetical protein
VPLALNKKIMDKQIKEFFKNLESRDNKLRLNSMNIILNKTEKQVEWIYDVWDELIKKLDNDNSYQRSIGIMILCNLAKSDVENKFNNAIDKILVHTEDDKFITTRQCIQNCWKVALVNNALKEKIIKHLEVLYINCINKKHYNLLRQDIIKSLFELYKNTKEETIYNNITNLINEEKDDKHKKKYFDIIKNK